MPKSIIDLNATKENAINELNDFIDNRLHSYESMRNYDLGENNHQNVSLLSPYIRHRLITEQEVISAALNKFPLPKIEKFIQEVLWRTYWKGWLELRPRVWDDYKDNILINNDKKQLLGKVLSYKTDIDCFNIWTKELIETNYLHNHARMWYASIWIHTLQLPWEAGANLFLKHLLDGDPASNTLSWRWVAGLQTKGKNYLATKSNIEKYSNIIVGRINLIDNAAPIIEPYHYPIQSLSHNPKSRSKFHNLLIFETELNQQHSKVDYAGYDNIFVLLLGNDQRQIKLSEKVLTFKRDLIKNFQMAFKTPQIIDTNFIENYCQSGKNLDIIYPFVGDNLHYLERLQSKTKTSFNMILRNNDIYCWQFANKGYFNFKKNIADILKYTSQDGSK